jgi:hypothetical protein
MAQPRSPDVWPPGRFAAPVRCDTLAAGAGQVGDPQNGVSAKCVERAVWFLGGKNDAFPLANEVTSARRGLSAKSPFRWL